MKPAPKSESELLNRALNISGLSLRELADELDIVVPENLRRDKGWVGQIIEKHLGAQAGSRPEQDFADLGIELKTIPISHTGKPLETTFVSVAPLVGIHGLTWENSHVRQKLSKVLWIPVEAERELPLAERRVGSPILWTPTQRDEERLRADWEEIMEYIALGDVNSITAHLGEVLQIRPKAANNKVKTRAYGVNGHAIKALPRGFYLRTQFTAEILANHFL
jgi:DNA mismatch repair protein MutH